MLRRACKQLCLTAIACILLQDFQAANQAATLQVRPRPLSNSSAAVLKVVFQSACAIVHGRLALDGRGCSSSTRPTLGHQPSISLENVVSAASKSLSSEDPLHIMPQTTIDPQRAKKNLFVQNVDAFVCVMVTRLRACYSLYQTPLVFRTRATGLRPTNPQLTKRAPHARHTILEYFRC